MALSRESLPQVLRMILKGEHYRKVVVDEISSDFMRFTVAFFKDIAYAKIEGMGIDEDWYKRYFLTGRYSKDDTAIYAGLNNKTIVNIYGSAARKVVFKVAPEYYDDMMERVQSLISSEFPDIRVGMSIRYNNCSVDLSFRESLIVLNTLATKHAEIRGGAWSGLGKRLELPLMLTLAKLFQVPRDFYSGKGLTGESREVDFHFINRAGDRFFCEVKLMGKGNPESADSTIARRSNIFIAHTLSERNKSQLTNRGHHWVALGEDAGYARMGTVFSYLDIPCAPFHGDLDSALDTILPFVFEEISP
ncbi:MAG: CfrBI family restriction endonuclease [Chloroflexi bacterium]|nr:CfrBI family restriction endonuclease [Chloroflexota bacterium]MYA93256.1 CfrBI family restriction endonuclease [Chloroflexota bacterium]MYH66193.1 CfrBI family restriction endonuclease [Chloroflexota bacterium]